MKRKLIIAALAVGFFVASRVCFAEIPKTINFQGRLSTSEGVPLNGLHDITVTIYDVKNNELFSETHTEVAATGGIVNLLIGSRTVGGVPSEVFRLPETFVGVAVDGEAEMTPRLPLAAVPYAYVAESAQTLIAPVTITGDNLPATAVLTVNNTSSGEGIVGTSASGTAVRGSTAATAGEVFGGCFVGNSHWGGGLLAESIDGCGIIGVHTSAGLVNPAVYGRNKGAGDGVMGQSDGSFAGVRGRSPDGPGMIGSSLNHNGVVGLHGDHYLSYTDQNAGVFGKSNNGPGGMFESTTGPAVQAIGEVKADSFSYSTAKTCVYDIGPSAFKPTTPKNYSCPYGNGGALIWDTGFGTLSAPVEVPDGAVINRMTCYFYDGSTSDLSFKLVRHSNSTLPYTMASVSSSGTAGYGSVSTSTISVATVDRANRSYEVQTTASWPGTDSLKVMRVVISYTTTQPE